MNSMLPIDRIYETDTLTAFHHPQPEHPLHVLIVPKRNISGLGSIQASDHDFLSDLFECVGVIVERFSLERGGYRLIANGGSYQEVPLLHFHLISQEPPTEDLELHQSP